MTTRKRSKKTSSRAAVRRSARNGRAAPAPAGTARNGRVAAVPPIAAEPELLALNRLLSVRLVRLAELISRSAQLALEERFDVKNTELRILVMLGGYAPMSVNELGRRTHIDKAWISRSLRQLIRRGLVNKAPHPTDTRATLISLTRSGRALLRTLAPVALARQSQFLSGLRKSQVDALVDTLTERAEKLLHGAMIDAGTATRRKPRTRRRRSRA